ncbi:hypothetical protein MXB_5379 [Myxobolus squamalis]|nr:hypothetical protein MXB_5379 [Myxobolus squamalis]
MKKHIRHKHRKRVKTFKNVYCGVPDKPDCLGLKPVKQSSYGQFIIDHEFPLRSGYMELAFVSLRGYQWYESLYSFDNFNAAALRSRTIFKGEKYSKYSKV